MTTIAQKIIDIQANQEPIGGGKGGGVFKLKDGWLLKVGYSLAKKINKGNQALEDLSLNLNLNITQAVNGEIYSLNTFDPQDNISIIQYVPNQKHPDFKKEQKKIEDFPLSAYVLLIGQMMDAIANGLYPDLIGANILVNYEEQSFQLIDSFTSQRRALINYNVNEANGLNDAYCDALSFRLTKLGGYRLYNANDLLMYQKMLQKLNPAITCMDFKPYESGEQDLNLQFPPFNTTDLGLITEIPLSADIDTLIGQLDIIEKSFPPHPICYLPDITAQKKR
ncbi:MAG: hypothetical protein ACK5BE_00250 [Alphaproteobacteria bacterium]|jgi:hypothetical protein